jgi:hypothetical protein
MTERTTSVLWYTYREFEKTSGEYLRARPETQVKEFVSLFRGFTSHRTVREVMEEVSEKVRDGGPGGNHMIRPRPPSCSFSRPASWPTSLGRP